MTSNGVAIVPLADFLQGLRLSFDHAVPAALHWWVEQRAYASVGRMPDYHLAQFNCEVYATWLVGERPRSPQVQAMVAVAGLVAFLHLA